jgi:hypothetical protein
MFHSTLCWNQHKCISMPAIFMLSFNKFVDYSNNALFTNLQCNSSLCIKRLSFPRLFNWYLMIYLVLRNNFHPCFFTYNCNSSIVRNLFRNTYNSMNYILGYMNKCNVLLYVSVTQETEGTMIEGLSSKCQQGKICINLMHV